MTEEEFLDRTLKSVEEAGYSDRGHRCIYRVAIEAIKQRILARKSEIRLRKINCDHVYGYEVIDYEGAEYDAGYWGEYVKNFESIEDYKKSTSASKVRFEHCPDCGEEL